MAESQQQQILSLQKTKEILITESGQLQREKTELQGRVEQTKKEADVLEKQCSRFAAQLTDIQAVQ